MKNLCMIVLIIIAILIVIVFFGKKAKKIESFSSKYQTTFHNGNSRSVYVDEVGGTVSTQMVFGPLSLGDGYSAGNTTVVRRLLGNNGKTVILLHNSPFDQQVWYPLFMRVQSLRQQGQKIPTLISYDLRAHGTAWITADPEYEDANPNNHQWAYDTFVDDLQKIYKRYIETGKFILVGYGFGGSVAQYYALRYPQNIEELYILQTSITGITGLENEIIYFSNWLRQNPDVTYLTIEQKYLDQQMCLWFENTDRVKCPGPVNQYDTYDTFGQVEYLIGEKLWRQASAGTHLQISKLGATQDLSSKWRQAQVGFPVTMLGATLDPYSIPSNMKKDFELIRKAAPKSKLVIAIGKHGFTMIHPDYIFNLIMDKDMSNDPLTAELVN